MSEQLETVHAFDSGPMPTGVSVSATGRVFVNFPKWGDDVPFTVAEIRDGEVVPYPDQAWNDPGGDDDPKAFVSVQSIVVDPADRLWVLDTGSPMFQETHFGGPKLVCIDLASDTVERTIVFDPKTALPTTYLNDVRFDLRRNAAFITDSADQGPNGIIVVDLDSGTAWRRLHDHPSTKADLALRPSVEDRPFLDRSGDQPQPVTMGADGIAISADGSRLWYCPLQSRHWYSVDAGALCDREVSDDEVAATVRDEGDKGGISDGLETDDRGRLYLTSPERKALLRRAADGTIETLVQDPRLLWPDTMSVAEGYVYVTANQLHRQARYTGGADEREYPYALFRFPIDAGPVRLT
ncbi:L-dopachrome tautomerase-related protein [Actinoplanes sp. RD1]|uniref:L-dopachrome tautomerase-related protein n=1 Tax=Actinoplanes sp. RD1 TaxID=3064538 RepID=UPI002741D661|nr:L-dopachrome tautomerase-related protein [Actinoplanes sp. RD1]